MSLFQNYNIPFLVIKSVPFYHFFFKLKGILLLKKIKRNCKLENGPLLETLEYCNFNFCKLKVTLPMPLKVCALDQIEPL